MAGQVVYCLTTSVTKSGMSRKVRVFLLMPYAGWADGEAVNPEVCPDAGHARFHDATYMVAKITGRRWDNATGTIVMGGCGYNTHHEIADHLGREIGLPLRYRSL